MKSQLFRFALLAFTAAQLTSAQAVVFTADTGIAPSNLSYDGLDVVVSNCVLTVDGQHSFASVRVAGTGVITHSASPYGSILVFGSVVNEIHTLIGTNAVQLAYP